MPSRSRILTPRAYGPVDATHAVFTPPAHTTTYSLGQSQPIKMHIFDRRSQVMTATSTEDVERRIIALVAVAAAIAIPIVIGVALTSDEPRRLFTVLAPVIIATVNGWMLVRRVHRVDIALASTALVGGAIHSLFGSQSTELAAGVVLVVFGAVTTLFVRGSRRMWLVGYSTFLALVGFLWGTGASDGLVSAFAMTGAFLLGSAALVQVARTLEFANASVRRIRAVLDDVPVAVFEEDFSELTAEFRRLRKAGVDDIRSYVAGRPEELERLFSLIRIVWANRACGELFGIDRDEILGPIQTYEIRGRNTQAYIEELTGLWEERDELASQLFVTKVGDLEKTIAVQWVARFTETAPTGFVAATDVTELTAARDALSALNQSKDEFLAAISHELRTPLTAVLGFAGELNAKEFDLDDAEQEELVRLIYGQSKEMSAIVEDLLVSARADMGAVTVSLRMEDLAELSRQSVTYLGADIPVMATESVHGLVDPVRFKQIVRNLLTNAQRYGGPNCWIEVSTDGVCAVVEVHDDGTGVPEELAAEIFDAFVTAHPPIAGTASVGLGLSVARYLARLMGGNLEYRAGRPQSTFVLTVPAGHAEPSTDDSVAEDAVEFGTSLS